MSIRIQAVLFFLFLAVASFGQTPLKFTINPTSTPTPGDTLNVEFRWSDFNNLFSVDAHILWDSTVMTIDTVPYINAAGLPGLSSSSFALPENNNLNPEEGHVYVNWFSPVPTSIPDSTHVFTLRFNVIGQPCDTTSLILGDVGNLTAQMTIVLDENENDIGAVVEGPIIEIPGTNCNTMTFDPVEFDMINVTTTSGSNICMPLEVSNFDSIDSFQGNIAWDATELSYTGVQGFGVTGLTAAEFNAAQASDGLLTYFWIDNSGMNPETLADGSTLFEVCFDVLAGPGTSSIVNVVDATTPIQITRAQSDPTNPNSIVLPFTTNAGLVSVPQIVMPDPVTFSLGSQSALMGNNVCVPVTVSDFQNIVSASGSINWDASVAQFTGAQNYALNNFSNNNINSNNAASGEVGFVWTDITNAPATLANGATLFELCFDMVGAAGTNTVLSFSDSPQPFLVQQENATPGQPAVSLQTIFNSGSLQVIMPTVGGVDFILPALTGDMGDNVCVPLTVNGFTNINSVNGSIQWDPTVLSYTGTGTVNLPGFLPVANLNASQTASGSLGFSWLDLTGSTPSTILDGGTMMEVCFDVVGTGGSSTALTMTNMPTIISVSEQPANPADPSIELDFTLTAGSYTVNGTPPGVDVTFTFPPLAGDNGDNVCIPLNASGFTNINSVNGSIMWDPTILEYTGTGNTNLTGFLPVANLNESGTANGMLGFSWLDLTGSNPVTVPSGGLVLEVCFDVIGAANEVSTIKMTDMPTIISVSEQPANPAEPSIELEYEVVNGTYTVINGPGGGGPEVTFTLENISGDCGDNVCMPLTVQNFTNINSVNGSVVWDATQLEYVSVNAPALPGFIPAANLNTNSTASGRIGFSWLDLSGNSSLTIADGGTLLEVCFEYVGQGSNSSTSTTMSNTPTVISVSEQPANPSDPSEELEFLIVDGSSAQGIGCVITPPGDEVNFYFEDLCVDPAEGSVCVPLQVNNFTSVSQVDFSLMWDPTVLEFDEIDDVILTGFNPLASLNTSQAAQGMLSFSWFDDSGANPETFVDGTAILEVCFDILGNLGDASDIQLFDGQSVGLTDIAVGVAGATPSDPVVPSPFSIDNGIVTLKIPVVGDFFLDIESVSVANPSEIACVRLDVTNFTNIVVAEWNIAWDNDDICFREIRNVHPNVPTLTTNFIDVSTLGRFKLAWSDPGRVGRTIPDDEPIFEICFDVKMDCGDSTPVDVLIDADQAAFFEVTNEANQTEPLDFDFDNGSVTACDPGAGPMITSVDEISPRCNGEENGSIIVNFSGGVQPINCSWAGLNTGFSATFNNCVGSTTVINLPADRYTVFITDAENNVATATYSLVEPTAIQLNPTITDVTCPTGSTVKVPGSISFAAAGSVTGGTGPYTFKPTLDNFMNINAGTYRVEVCDSRGCSTSQFFEVDDCSFVTDPLTCSARTSSNSDCGLGGEIEVIASGGRAPYAISYDPPITSVENIPPGIYCATVRDADGQVCKTNNVEILDVTAPLSAVLSNFRAGDSCTGVGGGVDIDIQGGCEPYNCVIGLIVNGEKQGGSSCSISSNINPGLYYLDVTDNNGNMFSSEFRIMDTPISTLQAGIEEVVAAAPCSYDNGSVLFNASGGCAPYTVSIASSDDPGTVLTSGGIATRYDLAPGTYRATISDTNTANLQSTDVVFTITSSVTPVTMSGQVAVTDSCRVTLPLTGGTAPYNYEWTDSSGAVIGTGETIDLVDRVISLDDTLAYMDNITIVVTDDAGCVFNFSTDIDCPGLIVTEGDCSDDLAITELTGGLTLCAGDQQCSGTISGTIEQCPGFSPYTVRIRNQNAEEISIIRDDVGPFAFSNLCAGSYTMIVTDNNGTDWFQGANIIVDAPEAIEISLIEETCDDGVGALEVSFDGGVGGYTVEWTYLNEIIGTTPRIDDLEDGAYFVSVMDSNNCTVSRVYDVLCDTIAAPCDLFDGTPVITPNGDGLNETLYINCSDSGNNELRIFDRWGRLVYSVADYNNDWSGRDNEGQELGEGAYYWVLVVDEGDNSRIEKGTVTILNNQ